MSFDRPRALLTLILLLYVVLGILFAVNTPPWQAPDEPAHYNYVRYLAEQGQFPVLHMGDYPHAYMAQIKQAKFAPGMSIDPIRYEFHQPPLYYALAAPIYSLAGGNLLALRLFSVLLGAGIVLLTYAIGRRMFPARPGLALGAAAFVAFLPQHLATVSQVGNDVLAELLFAMALFMLLGWVFQRQGAEDLRDHAPRTTHHAIGLGLLLGLILITKTTAYIVVPLAGGVLAWRWWRERASIRRILGEGLAVVLPAALIALPWYGRDIWVYGWPDFLGLIRHDQIVVGQTRTADFLAQVGWQAYLRRAFEFTFKSFWGVFGWLGVFMDSRVYFALAVLSGLAVGGWIARMAYCVLRILRPLKTAGRTEMSHHAPRTTHYGIRLLAISALLTCLSYAWYNTQFVQHQGRYLFTALIPIAIFFSLGWEAALRPRASRWLAAALVVFGFGLVAWGMLSGAGLPKWPLAITVAFAGGLAVRLWLPRWLNPVLLALPFAVLPLLDLYALFGAVIPQLR